MNILKTKRHTITEDSQPKTRDLKYSETLKRNKNTKVGTFFLGG